MQVKYVTIAYLVRAFVRLLFGCASKKKHAFSITPEKKRLGLILSFLDAVWVGRVPSANSARYCPAALMGPVKGLWSADASQAGLDCCVKRVSLFLKRNKGK